MTEIGLGVLNAAFTAVVAVALVFGLMHAGVFLEVKAAWPKALICWVDGQLCANFGTYERALRPPGIDYFCWY